LRAARLLCLLALAAGCGEPPPSGEPGIRVEPESREVTLGRAFELRVTRVWEKQHEVTPLREEQFAPLRVRLRETVVKEDARRVQETRTYDAYAFTPGVVAVPGVALAWRPKDGGPVQARRAPFELRVHETLDEDAPGDPELPPQATPARPIGPWLAGGALVLFALLLALLLAVRHRRRRPTPEPQPAPPPRPPPHETARARLAAIGDAADAHEQVAAILRAYAAERHGIDAAVRTTEELAVPAPRLAPVLRACDRVKFAGHEPDAAERAEVVARAKRRLAEDGP